MSWLGGGGGGGGGPGEVEAPISNGRFDATPSADEDLFTDWAPDGACDLPPPSSESLTRHRSPGIWNGLKARIANGVWS